MEPLGVALLLVLFVIFAAPLSRTASATPLTRPEVVKLLKRNVQERRLLAVVRELGIDFKLSAEAVDELRAAGAAPSLIAALQALASGEEPPAAAPAAPPPAAAAAAPASITAPATPVTPPAPPAPTAPPPTAAAPPAAPPAPVTAETTEAREESRPPHPLEPPPAPALPRGAAETMVALIPGPPPPPPPLVMGGAVRVPAVPEPRAPAAAAPPPAAAEPAAEPPSKWEAVRPLLDKAKVLAADGDVRGAQTLVVRAMEIDPGEPQVWKTFKGIEQDLLARAETFLADGQLQRAFREFQFVVTTNPESALGYNGVGLALLQLKNYDEAVAAFERALALDPANARYRQAVTRARSLQRASKTFERQGQQNLKEMIEEQPARKKGP
jgi:tetratricopeptide (TPR) repeat protein